MQLRDRIDWNLVPALDALLTERNVSRAARRLGVSQPSTSGALARLRRHFDDELLIRHGNSYVLTPLGERLAPLVRKAVSATSRTFSAIGQFTPERSDHQFTVAASEYAQTVLAPALVANVGRRAPGVRLAFVAPFTEPFRTGEDILHATDGWLAPREVLVGQPCTGLLADEWVCVVASDNPTVGEELTLHDLAALTWVAPTIRGGVLRFHIDGLGSLGIEPRIQVMTESFAAVPFLVAGSDRVGVMQRSLAVRLARTAGVRLLPCPWPVQALNLTFWWDRKHESDPAHAWLREVVQDTMTTVARGDLTWSD